MGCRMVWIPVGSGVGCSQQVMEGFVDGKLVGMLGEMIGSAIGCGKDLGLLGVEEDAKGSA